MSKAPRVAIAGGGLAGLAAAAALAKFGFEAEVFEAAPSLGEIGAGINISPQAIKALRAIGLGDKHCRGRPISLPGVLTRDMHRVPRSNIAITPASNGVSALRMCTFHRADLMKPWRAVSIAAAFISTIA